MYLIGFGKHSITAFRKGYAMQGFGMWYHRQEGVRSELYARVFYFKDDAGIELVYGCLDLGYITHAMRLGVEEELSKRYPGIDSRAVVLTCTHTHSAPGGCAHEPLYNLVTPGFQPDVVENIVQGFMTSLDEAVANARPGELFFSADTIPEDVPVAWNRSLPAYNLNPDVTQFPDTGCHLAVNREMQLLAVKYDGALTALLNWFGVHATALGNKLRNVDGDNKGYAAVFTEEVLPERGVAVFAQSACGDISPHYHGPGQSAKRKAIKGEAEYAYAEQNGRYQSDHALGLAEGDPEITVAGNFDYELIYADFSDIHVDPEFAGGKPDAYTSEPCHGVSFFTGTPVDGPGMPLFLGRLAVRLSKRVKAKCLKGLHEMPDEDQRYYERIYEAQDSKSILMESGKSKRLVLGLPFDHPLIPTIADPLVKELKKQYKAGAMKEHGMVPYVLPVQILILGNVAILACPGEFTTVAAQRLVKTIRPLLKQRDIERLIFSSYCNEYMGYVTTPEEYQAQRYEGGHSVYGRWTLGAFQTVAKKLAEEMLKPKAERRLDLETRPPTYSAEELALRSNLPPR